MNSHHASRPHTITIYRPLYGTETQQTYTAPTLRDALHKAELCWQGAPHPVTLGISPDDYATARAEDIAFNDADGLLIDAPKES